MIIITTDYSVRLNNNFRLCQWTINSTKLWKKLLFETIFLIKQESWSNVLGIGFFYRIHTGSLPPPPQNEFLKGKSPLPDDFRNCYWPILLKQLSILFVAYKWKIEMNEMWGNKNVSAFFHHRQTTNLNATFKLACTIDPT